MSEKFARWTSIEACKIEQQTIGHTEKAAETICLGVQGRIAQGTLFKAVPSLEILKAKDGDLIVGGIASWEMIDPEDDYITTKAMSKFLAKFFSLPMEYRSITIDHGNFKIGTALLQYPEDEPQYFSHVHEKGMYLITKVRDDKLNRTRKYRGEILRGEYKMYSISGEPIEKQNVSRDNKMVREIYDIDPFEVAIVKEGVNPKANFQVLNKQDVQKPFADYKDFADCVAQNQDKDDPEAYCGKIKHETEGKMKWYEAPENEKWAKACITACKGFVKDPVGFCGAFWEHGKQWYHGPVKTTILPDLLKMVKVAVTLSIQEIKDRLAEVNRKRDRLYRRMEALGETEQRAKIQVEIDMLYAETTALEQILTEKLKEQIEPTSKSRDLTAQSEAEKIFRKHFPEYER